MCLAGATVATIAFLRRDVSSKFPGFDGVFVYGPVTRVSYLSDGGNTPVRRHETEVRAGSDTPAEFCDDLSDRFEIGKSYRVRATLIEHDLVTSNGRTFNSCLRLKKLETLKPSSDMRELFGVIVNDSVTDQFDFAFDVQVKSENKSTVLRLCNETLPDGNTLSSELRQIAAYNDTHSSSPLLDTIFYNGADQSKLFSCFPLLALRNEGNNTAVPSQNIERYYRTNFETFIRNLPPHFAGD